MRGLAIGLTSVLVGAASGDAESLLRPGAWVNLAEQICCHANMRAVSGAALEVRWASGRSIVAIDRGEIVGHVSYVKIYDQMLRAELLPVLGHGRPQLPTRDVWAWATGWTHPTWRGRGLNLHLRRTLTRELGASPPLLLNVTIGLGGGLLSWRLGMRVVSFSRVPYLAALVATPPGGTSRRWRPEIRAAWTGEDPGEPRVQPHAWSEHVHLWASEVSAAMALDHALACAADHDLVGWRQAIAHVHRTERPGHWLLNELDGLFAPNVSMA